MTYVCENDLHIYGSEEDIDTILDYIGLYRADRCFDFETLIPIPNNLLIVNKEGEYPDKAIQWARKHWGSTSNATNLSYNWIDENYALLTFETLDHPPIPVIEVLSSRYPSCKFVLEYFECGSGFCGGVTFESKEAKETDPDWTPGTASKEWYCDNYQGVRGG